MESAEFSSPPPAGACAAPPVGSFPGWHRPPGPERGRHYWSVFPALTPPWPPFVYRQCGWIIGLKAASQKQQHAALAQHVSACLYWGRIEEAESRRSLWAYQHYPTTASVVSGWDHVKLNWAPAENSPQN